MFTRTFDRLPFVVCAPDTGGGGGQESQDTPPEGEDNKTEDAAALKARLEALEKDLSETRKEAASYRVKLRSQEEEQKKAEEARLKEQGEYKALAEQFEAKVKELEPKASDLEARVLAYETREKARIETATTEWPENLRALVEAAETVETKAALLDSLAPTVAELTKAARNPGVGPAPKTAGANEQKITPGRPVRL